MMQNIDLHFEHIHFINNASLSKCEQYTEKV